MAFTCDDLEVLTRQTDTLDTLMPLAKKCKTFEEYLQWARLPGNPISEWNTDTLRRCFDVQRDAHRAEQERAKLANAIELAEVTTKARLIEERKAAEQEQLRIARMTLIERKTLEAKELANKRANIERVRVEEQLRAKGIAEEKSIRKKQMRQENKARKKAALPFNDMCSNATACETDTDLNAIITIERKTKLTLEEMDLAEALVEPEPLLHEEADLAEALVEPEPLLHEEADLAAVASITLPLSSISLDGLSRNDSIATECVICMSAERSYAIIPCGHKCLCAECGTKMAFETCPLCRKTVQVVCEIFE